MREKIPSDPVASTLSLVTSEGWSLVRDRTHRKHCPSHKIWSYLRGIWSLVRVNVRQGFYCIAVRLTKWCISQTSAMLFAPVHGGCYIIFRVGIEYSCGLSVM